MELGDQICRAGNCGRLWGRFPKRKKAVRIRGVRSEHTKPWGGEHYPCQSEVKSFAEEYWSEGQKKRDGIKEYGRREGNTRVHLTPQLCMNT